MYTHRDPTSIQTLFAAIANEYDRTNHILSFGLFRLWNNALVKKVKGHPLLLDLCAGTGEIAFRFLKKNPSSRALLLDFSKEMLDVAAHKGKEFAGRFDTVVADAMALPLNAASVDAITVAYGIRNIATPLVCFKEAYRVLKPHGVFAILELTRPTNPFLHLAHHLYLTLGLPLIGKLAARNKEAYRYLSKSIHTFSAPSLVKEELLKSGFGSVEICPLMGGVATLLVAKRTI